MTPQFTLLKPADYREMPWKNGGGTTTEIAIYPRPQSTQSTLDSFIWRVSAAQVAQSGPFSPFPGYTRHLMLLDGDGVRLEFAGDGVSEPAVTLTERFQPLRFRGDWATQCTLLGGPVRDLNVMLRDGAARAEPRVVKIPTVRSVASHLLGDTALVIGLKGSAQIDIGEDKPVVLNKLDTLRIELNRGKPFMILMDALWPDTMVYIVDITFA